MKYDVAVIDPPWPVTKGGRRKTKANKSTAPMRKLQFQQGSRLDYATMNLPVIQNYVQINVLPILNKPATLFVWAVDKYLHEAEQLFSGLGFKLHARLIWDKTNGVAPAFTVRYSHEYLLWFYQSPMPKVAKFARGKYATVFVEPSREHSRKPECSYKLIESLYPTSKKIDVFSREKRHGWDQLGDQKDHFHDA